MQRWDIMLKDFFGPQVVICRDGLWTHLYKSSDSEWHNYGVCIKWSSIASMTVKTGSYAHVWNQGGPTCRQQKTSLVHSAFPLPILLGLILMGICGKWVFGILRLKIWGQKQIRCPLVDMQHARECGRGGTKFLIKETMGSLQNWLDVGLKRKYFQH